MEFSKGLKVVIVNGKPEVGKTTFEKMCQELIGVGRCKIYSSIDGIKQMAILIGWDGVKSDKDRKFLSDLKQLCIDYNDFPLNDVISYIMYWENDLKYYGIENEFHIIFVDVREPEEIDKFKKELNAVTLLIQRPEYDDAEVINNSDKNVFNYKYDYIVKNHKDLEYLKEEAKTFLMLLKD